MNDAARTAPLPAFEENASTMTDVRVGLCGFTMAFDDYVREFPVVEVQQTFYDPPSITLLQKWRAEAPTNFEFTLKAWQLVTHEGTSPTYRRLKRPLPEADKGRVGGFRTSPPVLRAWERTLECARALRATAVLLQCPRSFGPTESNVRRMQTFINTVERPEGRLLWEPRGDWPEALLRELCGELDLVHVVDPMQTESVTPHTTYYRLHGTTGMRHVHSDGELRELRDRVVDRPSPSVLFNNMPRVADAQRFIELMKTPQVGTDGTDGRRH
jgi:uncharacterized protein YecE (DUF72 family)